MDLPNDYNPYPKDFSNWYVLQVKVGKEAYIQSIAEKYIQGNYKLIIFSREVIHRKGERSIKYTKPLFPGYLFVYKDVLRFVHELRLIVPNEFLQPVVFNNAPARVLPSEMKLLLESSDEKGLFRLSTGMKRGDSIIITHGPLKNIEANVLFINKKKKKAKVKFSLFNKELSISLGLDILEQKCEVSF
jgi:transcriptional antiterminator NusG